MVLSAEIQEVSNFTPRCRVPSLSHWKPEINSFSGAAELPWALGSGLLNIN